MVDGWGWRPKVEIKAETLRSEVLKALEEVKDLPNKVTADWLEKIESDGEPPPGPPATPLKLKRAGEQAQRRRERQTELAQKTAARQGLRSAGKRP